MSWRRRIKNWLGNQLAQLMIDSEPPTDLLEPPAVERVEDAPPDAPLLGSEAESMLASSSARLVPEAVKVAPPLEGSADERRSRLRGL